MPKVTREQHKLLRTVCSELGLMFTIAAIACTVVPNLGELGRHAAGIGFLLLTGVGFMLVGRSRTLLWPALTYLAGTAGLAAFWLTDEGIRDIPTVNGVTCLASMSIPSLLVLVAPSRRRLLFAAAGIVPVLVLSALATWPSGRGPFVVLSLVVGWIGILIAGVWLSNGAQRAVGGIARLGRAHVVERQASEREAHRRYGARLLHDTVLATLALLAHSGVGVNAADLRRQSRDDANFLRELRLGIVPASPDRRLADAQRAMEPDPPAPLESVRRRFERLGLEVSWHGANTVRLSPGAQEALAHAVSECLENVRRHSGVGRADVTLTTGEGHVRAMVTDNGIGFEYTAVPAGRLGLADSVLGRIRAVDGTARVFSSPGAGTTIVLEVPR